jgi:hypothetical protein
VSAGGHARVLDPRPILTVTSRESLTLCRFTAVRREIATMMVDPISSATSTMTTPNGPVKAIAAATAPNSAAAGRVSTQPYIIRRAVPQRTSDSFRPAPLPITEPEHTCVVESSNPMCAEARIAAAEVVSAAKPCGEYRSTRPLPIVRMIRQPPE